MDVPSKHTVVRATGRVAYKLEATEQLAIGTEATLGAMLKTHKKKRQYSMSVKLIRARNPPVKTNCPTCTTRKDNYKDDARRQSTSQLNTFNTLIRDHGTPLQYIYVYTHTDREVSSIQVSRDGFYIKDATKVCLKSRVSTSRLEVQR